MVLIRTALTKCAPAIELDVEQPQYGQPSLLDLAALYKAALLTAGDQRPRHTQPLGTRPLTLLNECQ